MQRCSGSITQSTNTGSLFLDNMSWHIFLEDESLHAISKLCVKCSSMLSLKVLCILSAAILHTANRNHIMCQVVTYKKVKPMEIIQPLSQKWASLLMRDSDKRDLTRMVFTLCFGLRWSQMGSGCLIMMVGHTWKIDCITTVDNKIIYLPMSFRHVAR